MSNADMIYGGLREPFPTNLIHWRVGARSRDKKTGIALAYLNARDVMKRLDDVLGMENWQDKYPYPGCCELSLRINGEWITKSDNAGETQVEKVKGQSSDAFKRAAVKFGIGRYLYYLKNEWMPLDASGSKLTQTPTLPKWARPNVPAPEDQVQEFQNHINSPRSLISFWVFWRDLNVEEKVSLANSFGDKRNGDGGLGKTEGKRILREMEKEAPSYYNTYLSFLEENLMADDFSSAVEGLSELTSRDIEVLLDCVSSELQAKVTKLKEEL